MSQEGPEDVLVFYNLSKIVLDKSRVLRATWPRNPDPPVVFKGFDRSSVGC